MQDVPAWRHYWKDVLILVLVAIFIFRIFEGTLQIWQESPDKEALSGLGDFFGVFDSIVSAFAFTLLVFTVFLQMKELKYQRDELQETQALMEKQGLAMEELATAMVEQAEDAREQARLNRVPVVKLQLEEAFYSPWSDCTVTWRFRGSIRLDQQHPAFPNAIEVTVEDEQDNRLFGGVRLRFEEEEDRYGFIVDTIPFKLPPPQGLRVFLSLSYRNILEERFCRITAFELDFENEECEKYIEFFQGQSDEEAWAKSLMKYGHDCRGFAIVRYIPGRDQLVLNAPVPTDHEKWLRESVPIEA